METYGLSLEVRGLDPGEEIRKALLSSAEKLHFLAPSDSQTKASLEKSMGLVRASFRIASHAGVFIAETLHHNPLKAIRYSEVKLLRQLRRWRDERFLNSAKAS